MELVLELQEKIKKLDLHSQYLILDIVSKFLGEDYDDTLTDEDLRDIEIARAERANGQTYKISDIR